MISPNFDASLMSFSDTPGSGKIPKYFSRRERGVAPTHRTSPTGHARHESSLNSLHPDPLACKCLFLIPLPVKPESDAQRTCDITSCSQPLLRTRVFFFFVLTYEFHNLSLFLSSEEAECLRIFGFFLCSSWRVS